MKHRRAVSGRAALGWNGSAPGFILVAQLVSAFIAVLLLLVPSPLVSLGFAWRVPLILLGIWGVGAGLIGPLAMDLKYPWLCTFSHTWPSRLALGLFSLCWCLSWIALQS